MMRWPSAIPVILLVVAVPLFLITTNLNIVINSGWLYTHGFEKFEVSNLNDIAPNELKVVSRDLKEYFKNSEARLDVQVVVGGVGRHLFNDKEISHMVDVKGLVKGVGFWQQTSFYTMVGVAIGGLLLVGARRTLNVLAKGLLGGSLLTLGLVAMLGVAALAGFETIFTRFHGISFSNDLWKLDPTTDYLIRLFPQGFFLDATLIVVGMTIGQAVLTLVGATVYLYRDRALNS